MPTVLTFVGHSGSGKTSCVEKLVPELIRRGFIVATIKHAHHKVELDHEGKDSWRYKKAGARSSMLVTTHALQLVTDRQDEQHPHEFAARFFQDADIVIAEGFSLSPGPKIEVCRKALGKPPRCTPDDGVIARVTDMDNITPPLPQFGLDDTQALADYVVSLHRTP